MMVVFEKSVYELEVGMTQLAKTPSSDRDMNSFNRLMLIIMHLVSLLCRIQSTLDEEQEFLFKKTAYRLVQLNARGIKGFTPLHYACWRDSSAVGRYPVCTFPSVDVAQLLIEVGASVNAVDLEHNNALHIAAKNKPCKPDIMKLLLEKGAHLDACNMDHQNPMQMMKELTIYDVVSPLKFMNLQCIVARKIMEAGIPFDGHVPQKLADFVRLH